MRELRGRGIVRSENNPTGDLAEFLFCHTFDWQRAANSEKGFDAKDQNGKRYQIKGRRIHSRNRSSCQLSAIRDLNGFDTLAAVLFDDSYRVLRAALIPCGIVRAKSKYVKHTNSYRFTLTDEIWNENRVVDVTMEIQAVEAEI